MTQPSLSAFKVDTQEIVERMRVSRISKMIPPNEITWVRRVNSRWLVRQGLRESASMYLDHLEQTDPKRLRLSCLRARRLAERYGSDEDPKPWFYAGLFSLATKAELTFYLADHHFTLASIPEQTTEIPGSLGPDNVAEATWEKILRIREGVKEFVSGDE